MLNAELCLREMDRAGIGMSIISLTSPEVQSVVDPRKATELARSAKEYAASVIRGYPGRFSAFAEVALQDPRGAADELERAVHQFGFNAH